MSVWCLNILLSLLYCLIIVQGFVEDSTLLQSVTYQNLDRTAVNIFLSFNC